MMEHVIIGPGKSVIPKAEQSGVPRASILDKPIALKLDIFTLAADESVPMKVLVETSPLPPPPPRRAGFLDAPGEGYRIMSGEMRR